MNVARIHHGFGNYLMCTHAANGTSLHVTSAACSHCIIIIIIIMFYSVQNQCTDGPLASCASGQSTTYINSLAWPDPFSRRALSIRDDKRPCEKGLVQFTALTRSRTQHGSAGC